jgi:hypothetical protein
MDTIKRWARASVVEGLNDIGDLAQNFLSEGEMRQLFHVGALVDRLDFGPERRSWV